MLPYDFEADFRCPSMVRRTVSQLGSAAVSPLTTMVGVDW
jgi:hypothetical protein